MRPTQEPTCNSDTWGTQSRRMLTPLAAQWYPPVMDSAAQENSESRLGHPPKMNPEGTLRDSTLGPGERTLDLPKQPTPKQNWIQNSSKLLVAMRAGKPIRDGSAGVPGSNTGFLRAERNLLQDHG